MQLDVVQFRHHGPWVLLSDGQPNHFMVVDFMVGVPLNPELLRAAKLVIKGNPLWLIDPGQNPLNGKLLCIDQHGQSQGSEKSRLNWDQLGPNLQRRNEKCPRRDMRDHPPNFVAVELSPSILGRLLKTLIMRAANCSNKSTMFVQHPSHFRKKAMLFKPVFVIVVQDLWMLFDVWKWIITQRLELLMIVSWDPMLLTLGVEVEGNKVFFLTSTRDMHEKDPSLETLWWWMMRTFWEDKHWTTPSTMNIHDSI
jgi:hypothetical protein